jgi:hypothetical protein
LLDQFRPKYWVVREPVAAAYRANLQTRQRLLHFA